MHCFALLFLFCFKNSKKQRQDNSKTGLSEKLYYLNALKHKKIDFTPWKEIRDVLLPFLETSIQKTTPGSLSADPKIGYLESRVLQAWCGPKMKWSSTDCTEIDSFNVWICRGAYTFNTLLANGRAATIRKEKTKELF